MRNPESSNQRWLAYTRVSTLEQTDGTSLDDQERRIKAQADLDGATVRFFVESARSAKSMADRPQLRKVQDAIRSGQGDVVVVTSLDRLSRSIKDVSNLLHEFDEYKIEFKSLRENFDTSTAIGKGMLYMVGVLAEIERGLIAERTADGRKARVREGKWPGGLTPFGLARVGSKKLPLADSISKSEGFLEAFEPEAGVVQLIFDLYTTTTDGVRGIARHLNKSGYGKWTENRVDRILNFPYHGGPHPKYKTVVVPQIVNADVWRRAQRKLKSQRRYKPSDNPVSPFQGRTTCAPPCSGRWAFRNARPAPKYGKANAHCRKRWNAAPGYEHELCSIESIEIEELHERALRKLDEHFTSYDGYIKLLERSKADREAELRKLLQDVPDVSVRLEELEEDRRRLDVLYERKRLTDEEYINKDAELLAEQDALHTAHPEGDERQEQILRAKLDIAEIDSRVEATKYRRDKGIPMGAMSFFPETFVAYDEERGAFIDSDIHALNRGGLSPDERLAMMVQSLDLNLVMHDGHAEISGLIHDVFDLPSKAGTAKNTPPHALQAARGLG